MASNIAILILDKNTKARDHDSFSKYVAIYSLFGDLGRSHMTAGRLELEP